MDIRTRLKKLEVAMTEPKIALHEIRGCICFPEGEHLDLTAEERIAAEELQCTLHGRRLPFEIYRAKWLRDLEPATPTDRLATETSTHGGQYQRALAATRAYMEESR